MTPPINIDGTQITGASIDGQTVSEITVDGTEVFAANPIPDSAVHQWTLAPDVTTEDDEIGNVPITHNGPTRVTSGDFYDGAARDYDGTDDRSDADAALNFTDGELTSSDFAIGLTVDLDQLNTSTTKDANLLHHQPTNLNDPEVSISVCNSATDVIDFGARDLNNGIQLSADVSAFSGLLRILVSFRRSTFSGTIYYNAVDQAPSSGNSNFSGGLGDLTLGTTVDGDSFEDTILDNVIIYNQRADQSLADGDFALQPWS